MDGLEKFWNDLVEVTPKPITEGSVEILGLPSDGNDPVKAYGNDPVKAYGNDPVKAYGNDPVKAYGNDPVKAYGNDPVKADETAERTKALEDALARISELEKKLADIDNKEDGLHIES